MVAGAAAPAAACVVVLVAAGRGLPLHAAQPDTTLKILQKKRWPARKLKVQAPLAAPSSWSSTRKSSRERRKGSRRSIAVRSQTSQTEENGENGENGIQRSGDRESAGSSPPSSSCLYLRRTVRAGELLEYQGTVVVLGNVSQGAAILADGDIIVLGHLQGNVHAGQRGERKAIVFAMEMTPTALSIADKVLSGLSRSTVFHPEIASILNDGTIQICAADEDHLSNSSISDLVVGGQPRMKDSQNMEQKRSRRPALMALFTGLYIFVAGIALLLFPVPLFGLFFDVKSVTVGWIQVGAILASVFGVYYIGTSVGDMQGVPGAYAFYMSTVVGRMFLFIGFCWLVAIGAAQRALLLVGAVNLLGAVSMLIALQKTKVATSS